MDNATKKKEAYIANNPLWKVCHDIGLVRIKISFLKTDILVNLQK